VDGFEFVHPERVRFRDVDALGHVNNAVFLTYLEEARIAYCCGSERKRRA
jgi:acyl-CoA thioester hydrolase